MSFEMDDPEFRVHASAEKIGEDLCVQIYGGDRPHIGSVVAAEPDREKGLQTEDRLSAASFHEKAQIVSFYQGEGHKDGFVAGPVAERLSQELGCKTVVLCGIHYDHFTEELKHKIPDLTDRILKGILEEFRN